MRTRSQAKILATNGRFVSGQISDHFSLEDVRHQSLLVRAYNLVRGKGGLLPAEPTPYSSPRNWREAVLRAPPYDVYPLNLEDGRRRSRRRCPGPRHPGLY